MKRKKLEINNLPVVELISLDSNNLVGGFLGVGGPLVAIDGPFLDLGGSPLASLDVGPINFPLSRTVTFNQTGENNTITEFANNTFLEPFTLPF